jgi:succinoglycan biosynthesis transport protein ExoP
MNEDFREFLHIIFKRKRFVGLAFVVISLPIIAMTLVRPAQYRSQAKLLLVGNRSYVQLAPQDTKRTSSIPDAQVLNAEVENLKNWSFLLTAADRLEIDLVDPIPTDREERNRATARAIRAALEVTPYPTSPMIEVAYTDTDKSRAAAVANTVVETYLEYRPNIFESPEIGRFYARRAERLQRELRAAERRLDRYQRKTGIVALQQQRDEAVRQMMAGQLSREETEAQIRQTRELISSLSQAQQAQPEKIAGDVEMVDNPVARALEERIGILTVELSDLRQKYTDNDRRVQDKTAQIRELEREVASQPRRIVGTERFELNPVRQNLNEEIYRASANLEALQAKRASLDGTILELGRQLDTLNVNGIRYQELADLVDNKRSELLATQKRSQEAELSQEMTAGKLDSIRIVDRAQPATRPYNQNSALAIAVALIAGLGLGVAGAFGLEFLYRTYHFASDVERELELPVLGLISDFHATSGQLAR